MQSPDTWRMTLERLFERAREVEDLANKGYPQLGMLRSATLEIAAGWRRFAQSAQSALLHDALRGDAGQILEAEVSRGSKLMSELANSAFTERFDEAAEIVQKLATTAQIVFAQLSPGSSQNLGLELRAAVDAVKSGWRQVELELDRERSAADSLAHLRSLVEDAQKATGQVAQGVLSTAFDELSLEEHRSAGRFRAATFALVALSVLVVASPSVLELSGVSPSSASSWTALVGRLAIAATIGGAAAYCARQAGHHRRIHVWARSISTQLRSLDAFIAPVNDDGVRNSIIEATARRMLSEPPQSGKQGESQTDATSLLQLAADIARRPPA